MSHWYERTIIVVLSLLALTNALFLLLRSYTGPIWGVVGAIVLIVHWQVKRRPVVIMHAAVFWIVLHLIECILWDTDALSIFMILNIVLPIPLFYGGFRLHRMLKQHVEGTKNNSLKG
jgi:hypothetical protein